MAAKKKQSFKTRTLTQLKHAFVPHKGNKYRPHLTKPLGVAVAVVFVFGIQFAYHVAANGHAAVLGRASDIAVSDLLADTNTARANASLPALTLNDKLDQGAYLKAQDMIAKNYWSHTSPDGTQPWAWFTKADYDYNYAGENLAKNYPSAQATLDAWLNSPAHRANVLGKQYTDVGFAVVEGQLLGEDTTLIVAFYGSPVSAPTTTVASVQGAETQPPVTSAAATTGFGNPLSYFGSALQGLNPAVLAGLVVLALCAGVAITAHAYRKKLPKAIQKSWRAHHGLYAAGSFLVVAIVIVLMSGGGQI